MTRMTISTRDLVVGDRVIEARFMGRERVERSYPVVRVSVGRFVNYVIADEAGESLRTYEGLVDVLRKEAAA